MFDAANIVKNSDRAKRVHWIAFNRAASWIVSNVFARNVIIVGVDNSLPSHTSNPRNNFSVKGAEPTDEINSSPSFAECRIKSLMLILVKKIQNLAWVYITIMIIVICLLMEKKSI